MTLMMRPRHSSPTGTEIGAPVSVHSWPRTRPSEVSIATVRTVFSPRCCGDLENQAVAAVRGLERVQDRRQVILELHVDDGADDLGDLSDCVGRGGHGVLVTAIKALRRRR
jgi:hypothetical protein